MATKEKKQPALNVGYSDKDGKIIVTDPKDDSEVAELDLKAKWSDVPMILLLAALRYFAGYIRDAISAAEKAKGDVSAAVDKAIKAISEGTLQFRERGGDGGLSLEQEMDIIAEVLASIPKLKLTKEAALAVVQAKYAVTKTVVTPAKGEPKLPDGSDNPDYRAEKTSETHPEYRKLKAVPAVAEALAKAVKVDNVAELAALGIEAQE